ncbi:Outer membrane lipoprotein carrier protein domain-conaining protein, LolA-like [Desulfonema limicola]|uniref:Outer membrane lipoprotein carrier protein domain-conaining protein, LolA-like n=1 Tax=Desulfonema limicola TaxID=45656 RepID=A0A975BA41_9BACT|nr:outer membrane lipoprotein carrier protein LolA [Desulfonema limicola]QTA81829.1 Outer membrane lipoprotein carrier protein domain-conaining protein, LolA-like [Desulfonema limicola]
MLKYYKILIIIFIIFLPNFVFSQEKTDNLPAPAQSLSIDEILLNIEKRYDTSGFTALFTQTSVIKAMDIVDTAQGRVFIRRPGMMRWEYETPEKQIILTNGDGLWVFRPDDNQVMTGSAPAYLEMVKELVFFPILNLYVKNLQ